MSERLFGFCSINCQFINSNPKRWNLWTPCSCLQEPQDLNWDWRIDDRSWLIYYCFMLIILVFASDNSCLPLMCILLWSYLAVSGVGSCTCILLTQYMLVPSIYILIFLYWTEDKAGFRVACRSEQKQVGAPCKHSCSTWADWQTLGVMLKYGSWY